MGWLWSTVDLLGGPTSSRPAATACSRGRRSTRWRASGRWSTRPLVARLGLGLELYRRGERVFVGHGGAMPGFLAGVCIHRPERTGVVLVSSGAGAGPEALALDLAEAVLDALPRAPDTWRPDDGAPDHVAPILGRWWSEGSELV